MVKKKSQGYALMVVIMIVAVLLVLGAATLNLSSAETHQTIRDDKKLQAHYLARSGAEAALKAWEDSSPSTKPSGSSSTVYLDATNEFTTIKPASFIGKFDITVTPPSGGSGTTTIKSVGMVGSVQQTVTITVKETMVQVPVPPAGEKIPGETIGWYDFTSGQIHTGVNTPAPKGKTVKFEAKNGKGLKIPNKNSPAAEFTAEKMVFLSQLQVVHNSVILNSNIISFNFPVDFSSNSSSKGNITLKVYDTGITRPGRSGYWGMVYFGNQGYYFQSIPEGIVLRNQRDIDLKLEKMISTDPNSKNPFTTGETQSMPTYSIIWS